MPLDALHLFAVTKELNDRFSGGRIDKVNMPSGEDIILSLHNNNAGGKLLLSANPAKPRIWLTDLTYKNPTAAPSFCMHLRKYLSGARILSISSSIYERVVDIAVESRSEIGDRREMHLLAELMGRHSNLMLLDNGVITDCLKHVPLDLSAARQILPNMRYTPVPQEGKSDIRDTDRLAAHLRTFTGGNVASYLLASLSGLASVTVEQSLLSHVGFKELDRALTDAEIKAILDGLCADYQTVEQGRYQAKVIGTDRPTDFFILDYHGAFTPAASVLEAERKFYSEVDRKTMWDKLISVPKNTVQQALKRNKKRAALLRTKLSECADAEKLKLYGELLTANVYRIQPRLTEITLDNYYTDTPVTITLDPTRNAIDNANSYYKRYAKLKRAAVVTETLIAEAEGNIAYLESVLQSLATCQTVDDVEQVKEELRAQGLLPSQTKVRGKQQPKSEPILVEYEGYRIYVGKNNLQNEALTFKSASSMDVWFHVLGSHGSHVIVVNPTKQPLPNKIVQRAAELAAFYSQAAQSGKTPVDYTYKKHVTKKAGGGPGNVNYTNQSTVYVTPVGTTKSTL